MNGKCFLYLHVLKKQVIPILILLCLIQNLATAQDTLPHRLSITGGYHRGFIIAHRPLIVPLQQDKVNGFELSTALKTNGSKPWHRIYAYPDIGISLSAWNLGNREQLGTSISLIPYIDFPLVSDKSIDFNLKFGWGVGFIEKRFETDRNYKNVAIGSRLNCSLILQPHIKIDLNESLALNGGISMVHYSNGSVVIPNLGLNIASITAGIHLQVGKPVIRKHQPLPELEKLRNYTFFVSGSTKQVYPANGKNYFAATLSGNRAWQVTRKSAFGTGIDVFYDHSIYRKADDQNIKINNTAETIRTGIHGSYELIIADVSLLINMGGYLYSKLNDGLFYHRVGIRYRINDYLFTCLNIKAHWGKADFLETGIGYRISSKSKSAIKNRKE